MHYIYVLKSNKDKNLYIGCTCDIKKRFDEHCDGKVKSTAHRRPLEMIYKEEYTDKYVAFKKEKYYKTYKGKKELKNKIFVSVQSCRIV